MRIGLPLNEMIAMTSVQGHSERTVRVPRPGRSPQNLEMEQLMGGEHTVSTYTFSSSVRIKTATGANSNK